MSSALKYKGVNISHGSTVKKKLGTFLCNNIGMFSVSLIEQEHFPKRSAELSNIQSNL